MNTNTQQKESEKVKKVIGDWLNAMGKIDRSGTLSPISGEFTSHMPGSPPFIGKEGL